jgi:hypothetical protein
MTCIERRKFITLLGATSPLICRCSRLRRWSCLSTSRPPTRLASPSHCRCPVRACSLVSSLLLNGATMSQESSLTQSAHSVRQVLTAYKSVLGERQVPKSGPGIPRSTAPRTVAPGFTAPPTWTPGLTAPPIWADSAVGIMRMAARAPMSESLPSIVKSPLGHLDHGRRCSADRHVCRHGITANSTRKTSRQKRCLNTISQR